VKSPPSSYASTTKMSSPKHSSNCLEVHLLVTKASQKPLCLCQDKPEQGCCCINRKTFAKKGWTSEKVSVKVHSLKAVKRLLATLNRGIIGGHHISVSADGNHKVLHPIKSFKLSPSPAFEIACTVFFLLKYVKQCLVMLQRPVGRFT